MPLHAGERLQRRIPQLDAVRGVAILIVMFHNISPKYPVFHLDRIFADGWMGVDLFFVLSGFLITGILLNTKQSGGYFKNFYVRRCLRIWPLYYSLIFFMFVVVRFLNRSEYQDVLRTSSPWWAFPLFLQNFLLPVSTNAAGPLGVTWSLAIEEQFYAVWPLVVRFCSRTQLRRIAIAEICISPALRYYLALHRVDLYTNVFCRLDGLMAGALLALLVRAENFVAAKFLKRAWILLVVGGSAGIWNGSPSCQMDCFFLHCVSLGIIHLRFDVFETKMAPSGDEQPIPDLYRDHQLRALLVAQNSFRHRANSSPGPESLLAAPNYFRRKFCASRALLESVGKAVSELEEIFRIEANSSG